jgi:hypothetical protein
MPGIHIPLLRNYCLPIFTIGEGNLDGDFQLSSTESMRGGIQVPCLMTPEGINNGSYSMGDLQDPIYGGT